LPLSRTLIVAPCIVGLLAFAAATEAQKGKTARSHLVKTPRGNQLAVPVTVNYTLEGGNLDRSRLITRVAVAAKLPGGRVLRAVERRNVPGKARVEVEHHPFFSVSQTRVLLKALAGRRAVKATVSSSLRADLNGDGKTDARSSRQSSQVLASPTPARPAAPGKNQRGDDPCGVLKLTPATCTNVTGRAFTARHLWDSASVNITCPRTFPFSARSASTKTGSRRYTQTVGSVGAAGGVTEVTIVDDNVRGHPVTYTPTAACTTTR